MAIPIDRLDREDRITAQLADRETGSPDNHTSREELEAFLAKYSTLGLGAREGLLRRIDVLEGENIAPERRARLQEIAVALAREDGGNRRRPYVPLEERLRALGITEKPEEAYVGRLWATYSITIQYFSGQYGRSDAFEDLVTDGDFSASDRERISFFAPPREDDLPGQQHVRQTALEDFAERRAGVYRAMYGEAVRAGVVLGDRASPLKPPSELARVSLRNGDALKAMRERRDRAAVELLERHGGNLLRRPALVRREELAGIVNELVRAWDKDPMTPTGSKRLVHALLPVQGESPIRTEAMRSTLALAITTRLTDAQLAALDPQTAASLAAGLAGGRNGSPQFVDDQRTHDELRSGYLLEQPADGPRTFFIENGQGPIHLDQLNRLRRLVTSGTWSHSRRGQSETVAIQEL